MYRIIIKLLALTLCANTWALPISLKDHYPQYYVVKKGDTLYEIAAKYLSNPWQWRQLTRANPGLKPKKLYPGTVLKLEYMAGKPQLRITRNGTYKLSPHARPRPAESPIPAIHLNEIEPFLNRSKILDDDALCDAGYVVAYDGEHLMGSQSNEVYVKDLVGQGKDGFSYGIYRPSSTYVDINDKERVLGYKATFVGNAQLLREGNPATLELTSITQGVRINDRVVLYNSPDFDMYFEPKAPEQQSTANIIDLIGGLDQIASNQIIVLDKGQKEHVEQGDMYNLWQKPRFVPDPMHKKEIIKLPSEIIGQAMVFNTFSHTSFALVVKATRAIKTGDIAQSP